MGTWDTVEWFRGLLWEELGQVLLRDRWLGRLAFEKWIRRLLRKGFGQVLSSGTDGQETANTGS